MGAREFVLTHKYKGRIQIFVMFLHEFPIVLFCFLSVMFVELGAKIRLVL